MQETESRPANRLVHETSPYLLQHAHNPVDWHPWGEEALAKAKELDRPILLSVGYSACHWCHVMEHESFEDEEIAALMNRLFINVKVDREERPDVDSLYMNYVQMTTGSGGWPLTVFLTPDMVPFYGGTYFPPEDRFGRPGFQKILHSVAEAYRNRREELRKMRPEIISRLTQAVRFETPETPVQPALLDEAAANLNRQYDARFGGFGSAPKFPSSMALSFLLRHHARRGSESSLEMVTHSLTAMARGGIYDQLGGGFHRYTVDGEWLVPHFEKMLYDNALLSRTYLEAYQVTGDPLYRRVVEQTLDYVTRDLRDGSGGFHSAEDADSEGEEGKFYLWDKSEVVELLPGEDAALFCDFYDVTESGNFEGRNILHVPVPLEEFAQQRSVEPDELRRKLDECAGLLFEARAGRVRPGLDDKILASWNGWMLTAFSLGAFVLKRGDWLEIARQNAEFLATRMMEQGRLHRSWKADQARLSAYLEDYAAVAEGFVTLFEATGEMRWLHLAEELAERLLEDFWDPERGDFYFTAEDRDELLIRQKEHLDNATPSGNSNACMLLVKLGRLSGKGKYLSVAEKMLRQMGAAASQHPAAFGYWLQVLDYWIGPSTELVVLGPERDRQALLEPVRKRFLPNGIILQADQAGAEPPLLEGKSVPKEGAAAFLCRDNTCGLPVQTAQDLEQSLAEIEKSE